mmetsp:Transcript_8721/g.17045  ORF Transcript_8721/g.17045 Transcript_8721/m.17045 type:complete len:98 (-) Transcript_8721:28-321(-)
MPPLLSFTDQRHHHHNGPISLSFRAYMYVKLSHGSSFTLRATAGGKDSQTNRGNTEVQTVTTKENFVQTTRAPHATPFQHQKSIQSTHPPQQAPVDM